MKDFYDILGVSRSASHDEIKKKYRALAKKYHPDKHKGDKNAEEKFKEISEAYGVLGDAKKRQQFDQFGQWTHAGQPGGGGGAYRTYKWTSGDPSGGGPDFSDIFSEIFGRSGGVGGGMSGMGQQGARARQSRGADPFGQGFRQSAGRDVRYSMDIDFMEAMKGTTANISVHRNGKTSKLSVKIPAGVHDGQKIRVAGKGEAGGDLYIVLHVKAHKQFRLQDKDIYLDLPISLSESILGCTVKVPTIDGPVSLKVPAGTSSGAKLRLKGKGARAGRGKTRGDQYTIVKIVLPKKIDDNLKQLGEALAEKVPYKVRGKDFAG